MAKKIIALLLAAALTVTASVGLTLAYLTDRDSEANVFTVGDVKIDLEEDFEHGAELIPGLEIEKKPTITNTGVNDAWVWLEFAIPAALDNYVQGTEQGSNENVIHWNPKGATTEGYVTDARVQAAIDAGFFGDMDTSSLTAAYINENKMHWNVFNSIAEGENAYQKQINGVDYNVYVLLYNKALTPGETTLPNIEKVFLDARVDIDPDGNWNFVENGEVTPINWNSETNGNPVIYASAYAMQKEGFETCRDAYHAYQEQWGGNGGEYADPIDADVNLIKTVKDLVDAAKNGGEYALGADLHITDKNDYYYGVYCACVMKDMTLDLNGHSITIDTPYEDGAGNASVLFYVYSEGASLTITGDGDVVSKHDAFLIFPRGVSEGVYIYGGNFYNNDDTSGTKNDINAIVYSQTNNNIHIYGGTFNFKNVSGHCGAFNVYDNSGAEIVLHEGVLLSNSNYYKGSDADEIHLAEGCTLVEVTIDGETWYKVVK